jgi:hypothetical protein
MAFHSATLEAGVYLFFVVVVVVAILGLELRAYTLSHSTSPFFVKGFFEIGS